MSAQGNALGNRSDATASPNGAALCDVDLVFGAAPLGLSVHRIGVPRPLAWANIGLARWTENGGTKTRQFNTWNNGHNTKGLTVHCS